MAKIHLLIQTKETIVATYSNSLTCGRFINSNHNKYNEGQNRQNPDQMSKIKVQGWYNWVVGVYENQK